MEIFTKEKKEKEKKRSFTKIGLWVMQGNGGVDKLGLNLKFKNNW